jgi:hypothetical protein
MGTVRTGQTKTDNPKFAPGKSYKWEPTDDFILNGEEFSFLLETMRLLATTADGVIPVNKVKAHAIFENMLVQGVEGGVILEQVEEAINATDAIPFVDMPKG